MEILIIRSIRYILLSMLFGCFIAQTSQACTTFSFDHIFGKNYDWHLERGLVIINKRGVSKKCIESIAVGPGPFAQWTSKYGSLTFNQYGRELPNGGINEAGLVVEIMELMDTKYPSPDSRPCIGHSQWIQYQLDNFSRVEQVIASNSQIRIYPLEKGEPGAHFLVMDKTGNCAVIEFLDGKMVYRTQKALPFKSLTNSTYNQSITYLKRHNGFGGNQSLQDGTESLHRFVRAVNMLKEYSSKSYAGPLDYAFDILEYTKQPSTKWSIVYDVQNLKIYFRINSGDTILNY